jgi:NitT/TauT family transport system permease protein
MFIVVFGLGDAPQILIGFMLAVVAVIMSTLSGLDRVSRVLLKTARAHRLGPLQAALRITLPCAAPYLLTGVKLAVAYAFIGVIGAEFIMSNTGIGYEISYAYNDFDNATMYPLIVLILVLSVVVNAVLSHWEAALMRRRGYL